MALARNREIVYKDFVEFIEHATGKKVLSWRRETARIGIVVYFTDETMTYIDHSQQMDIERMVFEPIPRSICASCGQDMHVGTIDWLGRCEHTVKHFWEKVRKIYWHRYTQNK